MIRIATYEDKVVIAFDKDNIFAIPAENAIKVGMLIITAANLLIEKEEILQNFSELEIPNNKVN